VKAAVFNASPLIILARAGYLELVPRLVSPVVVPQAVVAELDAGPAGDPAAGFIGRAAWAQVVEGPSPAASLTALRLGPGETAVLEFAKNHPGTVAVLDDKAARRAAMSLGIPLTGTLGLLVVAAENGWLPSLADGIDAVRRSGLYVDPTTVAALTQRRR
jgi:predicted nucleic acid-binding protein